MRISTKCSIALHCLICIAVFDGRRMTSTGLAASTGSNPVVIRNLFGALQKAGILSVARGTGGAVLLRSPEEITVWDVYAALESDEKHELLGMHPNPSPQCPVGSRIRSVLQEPYDEIFTAMQKKMQEITLQDLLDRWKGQAGGSFPPAL
ncbi:Rrf2 family transcriptional regulator [Hydrogenoanaerobacterium saccharovorans]|uniref:Rrf2 family transcriptional regulator n=1 Tax=Hydrogenoanaerobacterium saccharovorans TaxID=474960 RepID=A0ABS2GLP1_9FIRM|nr:Rrf2 family transcriptional regulator [Hydrogenoanaerobacterium saccharovorans]MBM6922400.1 Rrf2 family transcriptional regulator [Hydrogenoanaerobacterium saccharovorans]